MQVILPCEDMNCPEMSEACTRAAGEVAERAWKTYCAVAEAAVERPPAVARPAAETQWS